MAVNHSEKGGKYVLLVDSFDRQEFDKNGVFKSFTRFVKGDLLNLGVDDEDRLLGAGAVALSKDKDAVADAQATAPVEPEGDNAPASVDPAQINAEAAAAQA